MCTNAKYFRGHCNSIPWTLAGRGFNPLVFRHPARGPKAGPWTPPKINGSRLRARYVQKICAHNCFNIGSPRICPPPQKKSARAYALAMCAPRTCLPKKKSAHPPNSKKSARASRSLCALRAHVCPPIIKSLPPSCPPHFLNPGAATANYVIHQQNIEKNRMFQTHTKKMACSQSWFFSSFWSV